MRAHEIMEDASSGTTTSGGIATVAVPLSTVSRSSPWLTYGKYSNAPKLGNDIKRTDTSARKQSKKTTSN